jgi:hypothetical protein
MQRVYVDLGIVPHPARAALTGNGEPVVAGILGTELNLGVHYFRNSTQEALANSSTGKLTIKSPGALTGEALFLDTSMTVEGSGVAAVYRFSGVLSSDELIADLGELPSKVYRCSVAWTEPGKAEDKCLDFDLTIHNSGTRPGDVLPATTDARWEWIKAAAPVAKGFVHDDNAKTIAVDAGFAAHSTLAYASSVALNFAVTPFQTLTLTGVITFTTSNLAPCRSKTIRIIGDSSSRALTFPVGWTFVGAAAPTELAAGKTAILTLTSFGTTDANVVAAYAAQP